MNQKRMTLWVLFLVGISGIVVAVLAVSGKGGTPLPTQAVQLSAPVTAADHTLGSSSAPVTIVEYADFQCPACQEYSPIITQLLKDEGPKVYFAYRYFPLSQHMNALPSAQAAEAAGLQGKFWEMHDLLFTNHADWENLQDPTSVFMGYAKSLGLDTAQFALDMKSAKVADAVNADLALANANQLTYTPSIFVNGVLITNPSSYTAFKQVVDTAAGTPAAQSPTSNAAASQALVATSTAAAPTAPKPYAW
jgi:protein-disulfide isomerase